MADGFWQNAAWETLDECADSDHDHDHDHCASDVQTQSVPESTPIFGLLGMAVLGIASLLQNRYQKIKGQKKAM